MAASLKELAIRRRHELLFLDCAIWQYAPPETDTNDQVIVTIW